MNDWKWAITLATGCCICLTMVPSTSADYVGVATVIKDDPDTEFLCTQGNGDFIPGPLTVCNVFAVFDNPDDILANVAHADLQVYNGTNPDVFFQPPAFFLGATAYPCNALGGVPDLICDTFITIGLKCVPMLFIDGTFPDDDFVPFFLEFQTQGEVHGGWANGVPSNGQGFAGNYPGLQVLFLQSSVAQGLSLSGDTLSQGLILKPGAREAG